MLPPTQSVPVLTQIPLALTTLLRSQKGLTLTADLPQITNSITIQGKGMGKSVIDGGGRGQGWLRTLRQGVLP